MKSSQVMLIAAIACSATATFATDRVPLVFREVPPGASFVVIPANDSELQVQLADAIEALLLEHKVRVMRRPALHTIEETTKSSATATTIPSAAGAVGKSTTTTYFSIDTSDADYVVLTTAKFVGGNFLQIVRRPTRELLAHFPLGDKVSGKQFRFRFAEALVGLGLERESQPPSKTKSTPYFAPNRAVPPHPVFTVLAASNYVDQVIFAKEVELMLLRLAVKVSLPPAVKYVVETKSAGVIEADMEAGGSERQEQVVERYKKLELDGVNYIVETKVGSGRMLKIVNVTTNEVIGAIDLSKRDPEVVHEYRQRQKALTGKFPTGQVDWPLEMLRARFVRLGVLGDEAARP